MGTQWTKSFPDKYSRPVSEELVHRCVVDEGDVIQEKLHHNLTYNLELQRVYNPTSTCFTILSCRTEHPSRDRSLEMDDVDVGGCSLVGRSQRGLRPVNISLRFFYSGDSLTGTNDHDVGSEGWISGCSVYRRLFGASTPLHLQRLLMSKPFSLDQTVNTLCA